jgi:hypothetical protein
MGSDQSRAFQFFTLVWERGGDHYELLLLSSSSDQHDALCQLMAFTAKRRQSTQCSGPDGRGKCYFHGASDKGRQGPLDALLPLAGKLLYELGIPGS